MKFCSYLGILCLERTPDLRAGPDEQTITIKIEVTTDNPEAVKSALKGAKITVE